MFVSTKDNFERNIEEAASYKAAPALLTTATGERVPAVMLKSTRYIKAVMPVSEALRLANQIADAVEAHDAVTKAGV